jgi:hypothetical protein
MANKMRYSNKGSQEGINAREVGGGLVSTDGKLTADMVSRAMNTLAERNPGFDKLSAQRAAQEVRDLLKRMGFRGSLTVHGGQITDPNDGVTVRIYHAGNDKKKRLIAQKIGG